eukprot:gene101-135_t
MKYHRLFYVGLLAFCLLGSFQHPLIAQNVQEIVGLPVITDFSHNSPVKVDAITEQLPDSLAAIELLKPKPQPLEIQSLSEDDPLKNLEPLITKQVVKEGPYFPFVQTISIQVECINWLKNGYNLLKSIKKENRKNVSHGYRGGVNILFRKNIQLATDVGYTVLYPVKLSVNQQAYSTHGKFISTGADYVSRYSEVDHLSIGLRFGYAWFRNSTLLPSQSAPALSDNLTASWTELVFGAETRLLKQANIYGGCTVRIGFRGHFSPFPPATNYIIPGFGSNSHRLNTSINLYILYKISFLERMVRLK